MIATSALTAPTQCEFDRELIEKLDGYGPRYTSYPTADRFHGGFTAADYQHWLAQRQIGASTKPLSLYVHLPFCNTVCYYCACNKVITKDRSKADAYLHYLQKELALHAAGLGEGQHEVVQLHFGGGTPTFLSDSQMTRLMDSIREHFTLAAGGEFSIEIDPRKVTAETVRLLASVGFNRMSVGVQDFEPAVQAAVNRIQTEEETRLVIDTARAAGFKSVSVDLIYGLPLQTVDSVMRTVDKVLAMRPDRLAIYNYAHLPTMFMPQRRIIEADLPSAEVKLDILQSVVQRLAAEGYVFIGMDHFALPTDDLAIALKQGRLQRNFQGYSTHADHDLVAVGVSAIGKIGPSYSQNVKTLDEYYAALDDNHIPILRGMVLNADDILRRNLIQRLMCQFALSMQAIEQVHSIEFASYFAEELADLARYAEAGMLTIDQEWITVTPKGRFLIRTIAMVFDRYLREKRQTSARYSKVI